MKLFDSTRPAFVPYQVELYEMHKVRYKNDERFPFKLLKELPSIFTEAFQAIKFDIFPKLKPIMKDYINSNLQAMECLCIYAFWIVMSIWQPDVGITGDFAGKLRSEFNRTMLLIPWLQMSQIQPKHRDKVKDLILLFLAEAIRAAF